MLRSVTPIGRLPAADESLFGAVLREFSKIVSWGQLGGVYSPGPEDGALQPGRAVRTPLICSLINGASLHA